MILTAMMLAATLDWNTVAPDLEKRLARFKPVEMLFTTEDLTAREKTLLKELIAASRDIEDIYWQQTAPEDIALYKSLASSTHPRAKALRRFMWINGSRYDQVDEHHPVIGDDPMPPGRAFYTPGLTREEIEEYVKQHPKQRAAIYDERTVVEVVSRNPLKLKTTPYHVKYRKWLVPAAAHLRKAAAASDDKAFASFLRARAKALLDDDYYPSDLQWVALKNPKFDVVFAPYESYLDGILGVKTTYESAVMIRNEAESRKLELYQKYVPDIQDALPIAAEHRPSKKGFATPMEVMNTPYRAGDIRHGYQAVAANLPNDPRIHQKVGSKKVFFKNYMDARVEYVVLPIARRLLRADQAARATAEGYMQMVLMHEIAHGVGPTFAVQNGKQVEIRAALGPIYSAVEEAKADVAGMFGLEWLVRNNVVPRENLEGYYASYVGGIFRTVRFGTGEAHGRANMMEFNFLVERGAITRDSDGRYAIDYSKIADAMAAMTKELLEIEAAGDRARAEAFFNRYDKMPADLRAALDAASDIPVDFDPYLAFAEDVR